MKHCLTPYRRTSDITPAQTKYNTVHSSTRFPIENCFGLFVARWRFMYKHLYVLDLERMTKVITVCATLHNLCITFGDSEDYLTELLYNHGDNIVVDQSPLEWYMRVNNIDGAQFILRDMPIGPERPPNAPIRTAAENTALEGRIGRTGREYRDQVCSRL